ncbi:MAG: hypothetical protein DDT34_01463 [Firmicutes bacterium]|nr:hypothetical protein [Bacillota bacterium]
MSLYNFTGNPFVDTGLSVVVAKAREAGWSGQFVTDLTPEAFRMAVGNGKWLAAASRRLKAFMMIVGKNSPLTNYMTNPSLRKENAGKLKPEDDKGWQEYTEIVQGLLAEATTALSSNEMCECCGERPPTRVLADNGKEIGRDWFPLAGSLAGAESLPAASRSPKFCAVCLLAIQMLPLGVTLLNGKLACFHSTTWQITQFLVEDFYRETMASLHASSSQDRVAAYGAKGGSAPTALILLRRFNDLRASKRILNLPAHTALYIWLFTNSGQKPDCDLIEIPNRSLVFLWEAAQCYRAEVESLLRQEAKKPDYQLLECIRRQRDYEMLYPWRDKSPASKELFELYQTQVLGYSVSSLRVAEKMAYMLKQRWQTTKEKKLLQKLIKEKANGKSDLRGVVRDFSIELAGEGLLALEEYVQLFPAETRRPLRAQTHGWKWIWFYLNHQDLKADARATIPTEAVMFTNPKIKRFAHDVFDYYLARRGLERIKKDILDAFRRNAITTADLQRWFCYLAEAREGYSNEDWDDLCRDENGNNVTAELRFQFRLETANLYRQAVTGQQAKSK